MFLKPSIPALSCRWFLDKPVDPAVVRDLIARAARAASGGNLQPWQIYALTGAPLAELKRQVAAFIAGRDPRHDDAEYPIYPKDDVGALQGAAASITACSFTARWISTATMPRRGLHNTSAISMFFNAPVALFIGIDRKLGPGQWADLGGYIHALMFLARGYGLDTCAQESWARMHRIVKPFVGMPPEQMLFCAVAIGYGDRAHPANNFRAPRAELGEFCRFIGFE